MLRNFLIKVAYAISKTLGKWHLPYTHKKIKANHYYDAMDYLEPGDILLTKINGEFSNFLIPGEYKHAAIFYIAPGKNPKIIEAIGTGVKETDIIDFMLTKDSIGIYRPSFADAGERALAASYANLKIGCMYDYEFETNNKAFYCSELIYLSYKEALGNRMNFELRKRFGQPAILPQDFSDAKDKFLCIWKS